MSTFITTIYEGYRTEIAAVLTSHVEIVNPYVPDAGPDFDFRLGFGVGVGPARDPQNTASCRYRIQREFVVTLTRRLYLTNKEINDRITVEKNLLEDLNLVIARISASSVLNSANGIELTQYSGDSGIEFLRFGRTDLLMIQANFETTYVEEY